MGDSDNFLHGLERWRTLDIKTAGWTMDSGGVYRMQTVKGVDKKDIATLTPLFPVKRYKNIQDGSEKVEIAYYDGKWKTIIVGRDVISSKTSIVSQLSKQGINVTSESARNLVIYLSECIAINELPIEQSTSVMGWSGKEFVPYTANVTFDGEMNYLHVFNAVKSRNGDRDRWVAYTRELRRKRLLRLMMDVSFASPLIGLVNENPFVLHIWGGTGCGKTVGSMVAMSIWGDPGKGKLMRTMNMTSNSMMTLSAFLNNLPFAGDELQTIKTNWSNYDQLIMKVTEGIDRGRLNDGGKTISETKSWNCAYIFTGEEPCTKASSGGGVKNRVIEIECDEMVVENGNEVVNFVLENHGLIAREYIDAVNRTDVLARYQDWYHTVMEAKVTTDKQAGSMALILTADEIVSRHIYHCDNWLFSDTMGAVRSGTDVDVSERAWQYITNTIAENSANFQTDAQRTWGKICGDSVYINAKVLNELLNREGYDLDACKRNWEKSKYLDRGTNGYSYQMTIGGVNGRYYKLRCAET